MAGIEKLESFSEQDTLRIGRELASRLRPGSVVSLSGDLGAGKTVVIRGCCECLCPEAAVSSPSYTLINIYPGQLCDICHIDFYRIDSASEILELGLEEYFSDDYITLIEWGDKIESSLPPNTIKVDISIVDESRRTVEISR